MNEVINQILIGAAGDGSGGLIVSLLTAASARILRRFQSEPMLKALSNALEFSLANAFETLPKNKHCGPTNYYVKCMTGFLRQRIVIEELSVLLSPDSNFDIEILREQFIVVTQGYSPEQIPDLDFDAFIQALSTNFYEAVKRSSELRQVIIVERLDQLVALIKNSNTAHVKIAQSTESTAEATREILELLKSRYSQATPMLTIHFLDISSGDSKEEITIQLKPIPPEPDYKVLLQEKRDKLMQRANQSVSSLTLAANFSYKLRVEAYLERYREYLRESYAFRLIRDRFVSLVPVLHNTGSSTTHKVLVKLLVQKGCLPVNEEQLDYLLSDDDYLAPTPPTEPKLNASMAELIGMPEFNAHFANSLAQPIAYSALSQIWEGPNYGMGSSNETVTYEVEEVVLRRSRELEPFFLNTISVQKSMRWEIPVIIDAEELESEIHQILSIRFTIE